MTAPEVWHAYLLFEGSGEFSDCVKQPGEYLSSREALNAAIAALKLQPYAVGATAIKVKKGSAK
ncbi:hypothetical protein [Diaphorobacter sp.]|uniref:hypothetical protein n=1 Tax=Diaphorobacter sp. TaxID=1934310 RepID=UPI0028AEFFF0|nr:hypothetical protein [Diaphorobacter sp.]